MGNPYDYANRLLVIDGIKFVGIRLAGDPVMVCHEEFQGLDTRYALMARASLESFDTSKLILGVDLPSDDLLVQFVDLHVLVKTGPVCTCVVVYKPRTPGIKSLARNTRRIVGLVSRPGRWTGDAI